MMLVDLASSPCSARAQEIAFARHASESSASADLDMAFIIRAANILQTLTCLTHIIRAEADDPGKVRENADRAEEELQALSKLMRPILWNPK
jgi:hypothetical protein